jgi:6-phosphogluconate dehydrogenase
MQIGVVGLGRMGGNIVRRLMQHGHQAAVYDRDAKAVKVLSGEGAMGAQAYAEGFDILRNAGSEALPEAQRFDLNIADIAEEWRRGSVITSWLLDLTASALAENAALAAYSRFDEDSGEGRWPIHAAIAEGVPAEVLSAALYARFRSRREHTFADKILSAMREGFGGHVEPKAGRS